MRDRKSVKNVGNGEDQDDIEGFRVVVVGGHDTTTDICNSSYSSIGSSALQSSPAMLTSQVQPVQRWNHNSGMEPYELSSDSANAAFSAALSNSETRMSLNPAETSALSKNPTTIRKKHNSFQKVTLHSSEGDVNSSCASMSTSTRMRRGGGDDDRDHYRSGEEDDGFEMGNSTESMNSTAGAAETVSSRSTHSKRNSSIWTR
jgi:hypothetical protein